MPKYSIEENRRWQNSLPSKRVSADVVFRNEMGELLIVKTNYKDYWQFPGGVVDDGESPLDAVVREVSEEIGLEIPKSIFMLKVVMHTPEHDGFKDFLSFTFNGGILSDEQIRQIHIQEDEIEEFRFAAFDEARKILKPSLARRADSVINNHELTFISS